MNTINSIYDKLMGFAWFESFAHFVLNLGSVELWLIVIVVAVLIAFITYRKAGVGAMGALFLVYLLAYILFQYDLVNFL